MELAAKRGVPVDCLNGQQDRMALDPGFEVCNTVPSDVLDDFSGFRLVLVHGIPTERSQNLYSVRGGQLCHQSTQVFQFVALCHPHRDCQHYQEAEQ